MMYLLYALNLTCGHKLWVIHKWIKSQTQVAELSFLCSMSGFILDDGVRHLAMWEELRLESLLLLIKRPN